MKKRAGRRGDGAAGWRRLAAVLPLIAAIALASCSSGSPARQIPQICYLADIDGLSTRTQEQVDSAITLLSNQYQFDYEALHPSSLAEAKSMAASLVKSGRHDLVFTTSYTSGKALSDALDQKSEMKVVLFGDTEGGEFTINVTYKTQEAAYYAGIVAATESKTNVIGYISAFDNTENGPVKYGFLAGVRTVSPTAKVIEAYVYSYNSPASATKAAQKVIDAGADITFVDCGASAEGVPRAVGARQLKIICSSGYPLQADTVVSHLSFDAQPAVLSVLTDFLEGNMDQEPEGEPAQMPARNYVFGHGDGIYTMSLEGVSDEARKSYSRYSTILNTNTLEVPADETGYTRFDYEFVRNFVVDIPSF